MTAAVLVAAGFLLGLLFAVLEQRIAHTIRGQRAAAWVRHRILRRPAPEPPLSELGRLSRQMNDDLNRWMTGLGVELMRSMAPVFKGLANSFPPVLDPEKPLVRTPPGGVIGPLRQKDQP